MNPELEKYLNDEMAPGERADFEQQMADDPALRQQMEQEQFFLKRLQSQMLREKIAAALADGGGDNPPEKTTARNWVWPLVALLLVTAAVAWYFWPTANSDEQQLPTETPQEQVAPETPPAEEQLPENPAPTDRPIAEETPSRQDVPEPTPNTGVRGQDEDPDAWQQFVESVWQTRFRARPEDFGERFFPIVEQIEAGQITDAYARLQLLERKLPKHDTLRFLKGYCLLEMREGGEALNYFEKLPNDNPWQRDVQWYAVLAHLLEGQRAKALAQAKLIARTPDHPFREEARAVVERLE